jgi:methyl-accepting chemotaxis protein
MSKLLSFFLIVALIPMGIVGYLSFSDARQALQEATLSKLQVVRDHAREGVLAYLQQTLTEMKYLGNNPGVQSVFKNLAAYLDFASYLDYAKANPDSPVDMKSEDFSRLVADIDPTFTRFLENFAGERDYQDILLIVGEKQGIILYTAKKLADMGTSLNTDKLRDGKLARLWQRVQETQQPAFVDLSVYAPSKTVSGFVGVPVFLGEKKLIGVLALRFGTRQISEELAISSAMGASGSAFVVGPDHLLRLSSRTDGSGILQMRDDSEATKQALGGVTGMGELVGTNDIPALNAWGPIGIAKTKHLGADFDWAIITKIDSSEAFSAVSKLGWQIILVAVCAGIAVAALAFFLARTIAKPISSIAEKAALISEGDLSIEIPEVKGRDEVASLAAAFRNMTENLRRQTSRVIEGVQVLMTATAEITATMTQVGANTARVSSAITETTTTVEQVKQSAKLSSEKADEVSQTAQITASTSEGGKKATEETLTRIHIIRDQMESIGETVVKLSEHSQAIEHIIGAVQDLADQSNLLAVNASIEAARAGEYGKGFSVVAQEIKSLAEQSKEATSQIKVILAETRNWVSAVVMATEQGAKAVDAGLEQSQKAGTAIEELSGNVIRSSQAASVIGVSAKQQFVGVDQVSQAMLNIDKAMEESLGGMKQLEQAAQRLQDLGNDLQTLISRYKV